MSERVNGHKNRKTWEMSMELSGGYSEGMYRLVMEFMRKYKGRAPYRDFVRTYSLEYDKGDCGVRFNDNELSFKELNAIMYDLRGC